MPADAASAAQPVAKKPVSWLNILIGAGIQTFEVSTLGQPFEVVKTHMAANRSVSLLAAIKNTYVRGRGIGGFYQGLIPWAWIEASTKGGVLMLTSSEVEFQARTRLALSGTTAGLLGGMVGGVAQAYTTMGFCTFMKTVEVTRHKQAGVAAASTLQVAADVWRREGWRGMNRGVSAVALRQMTNWGSRFGITRLTESAFHRLHELGADGKQQRLSTLERIAASAIGGALACWNQPIEVIRVEMQSQQKTPGRPENLSIWTAAKWIYQKNGWRGFYRGVTPRVALGVYLTICMVFGGDAVKAWAAEQSQKPKHDSP